MISNMKIISFVVVGLILVYTANCDSRSDKKVADSINHFTLNLYKELVKTDKDDNVFCSGFSLSSVLNMLLVGAKGNTWTEINSTLGYESFRLSEQQMKDSFRQILTNQRGLNHSGYELDFANSAWIQNGFTVFPEFKSNINENFFVEEKNLDFANAAAKDEINAWVSNKTKGRIPSLFDGPFDQSTVLVLVNAIYFKGTWLDKFNKNLTSDLDFISSGNTKAVPMMNIHNSYRYSNDTILNAQILELPYTGEDVSMIIILPTSNDGLETLESQLTLTSLNQAINGMRRSYVHVTIPKFNISSTMSLNSVLNSLGIVKAFSQSEADLSGISEQKNLYVSDLIQKANIEVNEEGTVATAASGNILVPLSTGYTPRAAVTFVANHPFLFFIRQKSTGIILFTGRVAKL